MPPIAANLGVALDMYGCPNRCRHCWLGLGAGLQRSPDDLRWTAAQFRSGLAAYGTRVRALSVLSWFREPDYGDDYRALRALETELSDGEPQRYELLSVWRLARDESYVTWARSVGPDTCQITFFGLEQSNDWFYRRRGAFRDALIATERLLQAGMKPRWQLFLTTRIIPELPDLLKLASDLRLRERVASLGSEFQMFMHPPGPDGEGRRIEHLRPTADEVALLPEEILLSTRKHLCRDKLWYIEAELYAELVQEDKPPLPDAVLPPQMWFFVQANWDVYPNCGTLEPWWRLGNLKRDPVAEILDRFEHNTTLGLHTLFDVSPRELALAYGNPGGLKVYSDKGDLLSLYRARHCERVWQESTGGGPWTS